MSESIVIEDTIPTIIVVENGTPLISVIQKAPESIIVSSMGIQGAKGDTGNNGQDGTSATIQVGTVTTGNAGTNVIINNVGTANDAIFDFTIPRGDTGNTGAPGANGQGVPTGGTTNQALTKNSNTDYDTEWSTINLEFTGAFQKNIEIDFGSQSEDNKQVTISDANVKTTSKIFITPSGETTVDHDPEDYFLEKISAYATNIVNGAFDIIASANETFGKYKFNVLITN